MGATGQAQRRFRRNTSLLWLAQFISATGDAVFMPCLVWIAGRTMKTVACKPTQGKRRSVGSPNNNSSGFSEVGYHRVIDSGDQVALQSQADRGRVADLIHVNFNRDRDATKYPRFVTSCNGLVDSFRSG